MRSRVRGRPGAGGSTYGTATPTDDETRSRSTALSAAGSLAMGGAQGDSVFADGRKPHGGGGGVFAEGAVGGERSGAAGAAAAGRRPPPRPVRTDERAGGGGSVGVGGPSAAGAGARRVDGALPGTRISSDEERIHRKVSAIVAGLRSRYWGARGSMSETFRRWDADASGFLDEGELGEALTALGYKTSGDEVRAIVRAFDDNGDGVVQYEDFVALLCGDQKTADALPASTRDAHFLSSLSKGLLRADDANFAYGGADDGADDADLYGASAKIHASSAASYNQARSIRTWGGIVAKKVMGPGELADVRGSSTADIANGVGADVLREAVWRRNDRSEAEMRSLFTSDILSRGDDEAVRGAQRGPAAEQYVGPHALNLSAVREQQQKQAALEQGMTAEAWQGAEPLLLSSTVRARADAAYAAQTGVPSRALLDRTLNATSRIPSAQEAAPQVVLGAQDPSYVPPSAAGLPSLPGGVSYDPLAAAPSTGHSTVIVGTVHNVRPGATLNRLVEKGVGRARLLGRMPLEGTFVGEGTDSGRIAAALGIDVSHPGPGHGGGMSNGRHHNAGAAGILPAEHARASSRAAAASLRDERLMERTIRHEESVGGMGAGAGRGAGAVAGGGGGGGGEPPKALADQLRNARESRARRLGLTDAGVVSPGHAAKMQRNKALAAEASRLAQTDARERTRGRTAGSAGGGHGAGDGSSVAGESKGDEGPEYGGGGGDGLGPGGDGASLRTSSVTDAGRRALGGGARRFNAAEQQPGSASTGAGSSASSAHSGSILQFTGSELPSSGVAARMARAEGARTTYLIRPPPGMVADAAPEPPEWHYATATRLQQTQTPVPEQYFTRLARAENNATARDAVQTWLTNIKAIEDAAAAFTVADQNQRVERKREERARYGESLMARKGRVEMALFGGATKVEF